MATVFYPGMGVDIVTPVLTVPNLERIVATGPYQSSGKFSLEKTFNMICQLANNGAIQNPETFEWIEFWNAEIFEEERIEPVFKKYFFKKLGMWMMQFKYNNRTITLNYYINHDPNSKDFKPPTNEKFDYIIHKSYKWKINPNIFKNIVEPLCKKEDVNGGDGDGGGVGGDSVITTKLISTKDYMRGIWQFSREAFEEATIAKGYSHVVEQTKYTENPEEELYLLSLSRCSLIK